MAETNQPIDTSDISDIELATGADIYDLHGRLVRKNATTLEGLQKGIYIVNRKRVIKD